MPMDVCARLLATADMFDASVLTAPLAEPYERCASAGARPHRSSANDRVFFLYELFAGDAAFSAHQQTDAFKTLVVGHAPPKLARRERVQLTPFLHESTRAP
jgi:hypothetical protein